MERSLGNFIKIFLMLNKPIYKRWWIYVCFLILAITIPRFIELLYTIGTPNGEPNTLFSANDRLIYYSSVLAMVGTILGVFFSIQYSHKDYQKDILMRVLPYIAMQPLKSKSKSAFIEGLEEDNQSTASQKDISSTTSENIYNEYILEKIYLIIDSNGCQFTDSLNDEQRTNIEYEPIEENLDYSAGVIGYYAYYLINVGVGTAVNCFINARKEADSFWIAAPSMDVTLSPKQRVYLGIYVDGCSFPALMRKQGEKYRIRIYYMNIYEKGYYQDLRFTVFGNGYTLSNLGQKTY